MRHNFVVRGIAKIPGLRRLPLLKMLVIAEVALLARDHYAKLTPDERHRLIDLIRAGRGRPGTLSEDDRAELAALIGKAEPRLFAGLVADRLSPVPLPGRVVRGPK